MHHEDAQLRVRRGGVGLYQTLGYHSGRGKVVGPSSGSVVPGIGQLDSDPVIIYTIYGNKSTNNCYN